MTREMHVLPVQCKGCGSIFDLYYDLQQSEGEPDGCDDGAALSKVLQQSLCHGCRGAVLTQLQEAIKRGEIARDSEISLEFGVY